jgi:hypothetical protein
MTATRHPNRERAARAIDAIRRTAGVSAPTRSKAASSEMPSSTTRPEHSSVEPPLTLDEEERLDAADRHAQREILKTYAEMKMERQGQLVAPPRPSTAPDGLAVEFSVTMRDKRDGREVNAVMSGRATGDDARAALASLGKLISGGDGQTAPRQLPPPPKGR